MKIIEIYWNDLTKKAQKNIQETLGMDEDNNGNWDVIPMCSITKKGKIMDNKTLGIIYAIKRSGKQWNKAVSEYMAEYSGSPKEEYSEWELNRIMRITFIDYLETCDKPYVEVRELLEMMDRYSGYSMGHYLANVLGMTKVKEQEKYVNGFRDD